MDLRMFICDVKEYVFVNNLQKFPWSMCSPLGRPSWLRLVVLDPLWAPFGLLAGSLCVLFGPSWGTLGSMEAPMAAPRALHEPHEPPRCSKMTHDDAIMIVHDPILIQNEPT